jgi:CRISPR-associated endonuclease/helicase Cas3
MLVVVFFINIKKVLFMNIIAKSNKDNRDKVTLSEHTKADLEAFNVLFGSYSNPTKMALEWKFFYKMIDGVFQKFYANTKMSIIFHDLGKANNRFSDALLHGTRQLIRHEHLSAILLFLNPLKDFIKKQDLVDYEVVLSSIVNHHLKASSEGDSNYAFCKKFEDFNSLQIIDFSSFLEEFFPGELFEDLSKIIRKFYYEELKSIAKDMEENTYEFTKSLRKDNERKILCISVKSALIISDSVGSGLVRNGKNVEDWIESSILDRVNNPLTKDYIWKEIIEKRISDLEKTSKKPFVWEDFQKSMDSATSRSLLTSSCGSGKTLAAWRWIASQCPKAYALFLYPTRGTATEGFKDYVSNAPESDASLFHGTSNYDLEDMFKNPLENDTREENDYRTKETLYALGLWEKRVFSATVDTFLSFMANHYSAINLIPLLANSVIVLDEVHSYTPRMFDSLIEFLKVFDIPVLCMTASLPETRRKRLEDVDLKPVSTDFEDLKLSVEAPRYVIKSIKEKDIKSIVIDGINKGYKTTIVVNTIEKCIKTAKFIKTITNVPVYCYHSRFRLKDRNKRHKEVVEKFKIGSNCGPMVLVCTQVCEMSLNLDVDILVTELCPIPSFIQRLGRTCRVKHPGSRRGYIYVYEAEKCLPYTQEELNATKLFFSILEKNDTCSQQMLVDELEKYNFKEIKNSHTAYLDNNFFMEVLDYRGSPKFTKEAILDVDEALYITWSKQHSNKIKGLILQVPAKKTTMRDSESGYLRYLKIVPSEYYSEEFGYFEKELD